jgi:hypothetical protein
MPWPQTQNDDPEQWMVPMQVEMDMLKKKHTWDLVKAPSGANIMGSMWVYNIKWDGEGNRIKDKARLVGKGYMQQLGVDYNKTWAGVTRLESVRMTAAMSARFNLKLWRIDFIGAYLNSLTKEDIYMKQPEEFIEPGYKEYICKLVHTIYGTMQEGHDWYETLGKTYNDLGYTTSHADPCVRFKKETILLQIRTRTMFLERQTMMRKGRGGRKKSGEYGKLKTWGRMNIFSR